MFDFISQKFTSLFTRLKGVKVLNSQNISDTLSSVKNALLEADVPYDVAETFVQEVHNELLNQNVKKNLTIQEHVLKTIHDKIVAFLGGAHQEFTFEIPSTFLMMGLQGAGKTTAVGKLVVYLQEQARKRGKSRTIMVGSVDYYRPAAIDQLEIVAQQSGAIFYRASSKNPLDAAIEIQSYAKKMGSDYLILDTAGRLHVDNTMLAELSEINTALKPRYKMLVLDAMTGQESLNVARAFDKAVGFNLTMLTKMDSDTRGGAAFSFRYALKKTITFVGVGEKPEDLSRFHPERVASRIIGMGDMQTLVEQANQKIKQSEQDSLMDAFKKDALTLEDFAQQMDMVGKLGSLSTIMKMVPGMGSVSLTPDQIEKSQIEMKRFRAIINSMTRKERQNVSLLDVSRRSRIAKGAGVVVGDVDSLIQRFQQTQQYVKLLKKAGPFKALFR